MLNREKGVTFTEVMVTIAIIGIIAAIAIPAYRNHLFSERLIGASQAIYGQALLAKRQSVSNNDIRYFKIEDDSGYWCAFVSAASDATCATSLLYAHGRDFSGVTVSTGVSSMFVMPALTANYVSAEITGENGDVKTLKIYENQMVVIE
jgi:prepilin-type N-terminal cleavage/methylation domain-containing protein